MPLEEIKGSRELWWDKKGTYGKRVWTVDTHDGSLGAVDAECPRLGYSFSTYYPLVKCKSVRVTYLNPQNCTVEAQYDNLTDSETSAHESGDVKEEWDFQTRRERVYVDLNGYQIGPRGEGADVLVPHPVLTVHTWRKKMLSPSTIYGLVAKVNDDVFKSEAASKWLCMGIYLEEARTDLFYVRYQFEYNGAAAGWQYQWRRYKVMTGTWGGDGSFSQSVDGLDRAKVYYGSTITNIIYASANFNVIWP